MVLLLVFLLKTVFRKAKYGLGWNETSSNFYSGMAWSDDERDACKETNRSARSALSFDPYINSTRFDRANWFIDNKCIKPLAIINHNRVEYWSWSCCPASRGGSGSHDKIKPIQAERTIPLRSHWETKKENEPQMMHGRRRSPTALGGPVHHSIVLIQFL